MNTRIVENQMNMSVQITLFIQAGSNTNDLHGTVYLTLPPGDSQSVTYGDLRNSFLSGMKLSPLPYDPTDTYYCRVKERGDDMDTWLNHSHTIEVTPDCLQRMESAQLFKRAN
ncbi:hypothetical protein SAMN02745866_01220 [Alteromonadaceae bacterium Bs31]|nr:hypothetical protein SAMN02745866_01220 [Alteromonadaceae bacterium Bs31]